jgi:transposase-like protein
MKIKSRIFSAPFKAKIAVKAIKEQLTISDLAQNISCTPNRLPFG